MLEIIPSMMVNNDGVKGREREAMAVFRSTVLYSLFGFYWAETNEEEEGSRGR